MSKTTASPASARGAAGTMKSEIDPKDTDKQITISVGECIRLARELKDHSQLPLTCQEYISGNAVLKQAFQGMSGDQMAHAAAAKNNKLTKGMTHAQLQRRWTSRRDPLGKHKASKDK